MSKIWKDQIGLHGEYMCEWPVGTTIMGVAEQRHHPDLIGIWIKADDIVQDTEERYLLVRYTGESYPENAAFVGTVMMRGGTLVCHVFEVFK